MVRIRQLTFEDAEIYREVRLRALKEHPDSFASSYEDWAGRPPADFARRIADMAENGGFYLGAFDDQGRLIGTVGLHREAGIKRRHKGEIIGMHVAAEQQGQGIGRALLEAAIARARSDPDLEQLILVVEATNEPAYRLYRSLGFRDYGLEPHAMKLSDHYNDDRLMVLFFDQDGVDHD